MDGKLIYWTVVFAWLLLAVAVAVRGRALIRRGRIVQHRRMMRLAAAAVLLFLASYPVKLLVLGREDLSAWSPTLLATLRVHESAMLIMLLAGLRARWIARRWRHDRARVAKAHRRAGRVALVSGALGVVLAGVVLVAMFSERLGTGGRDLAESAPTLTCMGAEASQAGNEPVAGCGDWTPPSGAAMIGERGPGGRAATAPTRLQTELDREEVGE